MLDIVTLRWESIRTFVLMVEHVIVRFFSVQQRITALVGSQDLMHIVLMDTDIPSLKLTAKAPENRPFYPIGSRIVFQPSIFHVELRGWYHLLGTSVAMSETSPP